MKPFIEYIKENSLALGSREFKLSKSEKNYNIFSKKYLVAKYNINIGEKITTKNTLFKRLNKIDINEKEFKKINQKKSLKKIKEDQIIYKKNIKL